MCLVKQYCLASKSYSALASFCWTGILKIISKLFRYLFPSPTPLYYPRSSGRGTIKFLITNQILALLRSEAIFPVKQEWTVPSRSAKLLPVLSIRISSGDRMFRQWFMPRHSLTPYMPAPTARSCCWDKEQGERRGGVLLQILGGQGYTQRETKQKTAMKDFPNVGGSVRAPALP